MWIIRENSKNWLWGIHVWVDYKYYSLWSESLVFIPDLSKILQPAWRMKSGMNKECSDFTWPTERGVNLHSVIVNHQQQRVHFSMFIGIELNSIQSEHWSTVNHLSALL